MIVLVGGLGVYKTDDFKNWKRDGVILQDSGKREWDNTIGHHADICCIGGEAYIFYFTHPFFDSKDNTYDDDKNGIACIQVAKLDVFEGKLVCDRNLDFECKYK